jgi:uncharacterized protein YggE
MADQEKGFGDEDFSDLPTFGEASLFPESEPLVSAGRAPLDDASLGGVSLGEALLGGVSLGGVSLGEAVETATVETPPTPAPEATPAPQATETRDAAGVVVGYGGDDDRVTPVADVITAHGSSEVSVPPDCVSVSLGVDVDGATLEEARSKAAKATESYLAAVKALNIPNLVLKTHQVSLQPVHEHVPYVARVLARAPKILGYRATGRVVARLKNMPADDLSAAVARIIDTASKAGANSIGGIAFGLDKPEVAARQALAEAVADARGTAEVLAKAGGVSLAKLHSVRETMDRFGSFGVGAPGAAMAASARSMSVETPVEAGEIRVRKSVTCRWYFEES